MHQSVIDTINWIYADAIRLNITSAIIFAASVWLLTALYPFVSRITKWLLSKIGDILTWIASKSTVAGREWAKARDDRIAEIAKNTRLYVAEEFRVFRCFAFIGLIITCMVLLESHRILAPIEKEFMLTSLDTAEFAGYHHRAAIYAELDFLEDAIEKSDNETQKGVFQNRIAELLQFYNYTQGKSRTSNSKMLDRVKILERQEDYLDQLDEELREEYDEVISGLKAAYEPKPIEFLMSVVLWSILFFFGLDNALRISTINQSNKLREQLRRGKNAE